MNRESQNLEWKESWRDEYIKWVCGFANASGGKIIIGKSDNGDVVGVNDYKKLLEDIPNKVKDILGIIVDVNLVHIVHKDYSSGIPIQIKVYDDRIIFWNDGYLPEHWIVEDLKFQHPSKPFNPDIASVFFRAGMIESWGRGIEKIETACKNHGLKSPIIKYAPSNFMLEIKATELLSNFVRNTTQETTQEKIIAIIKSNPKVTRKEIADIVGLTEDGIKYHLNKLKKEGILEHIGSTKSGEWIVK